MYMLNNTVIIAVQEWRLLAFCGRLMTISVTANRSLPYAFLILIFTWPGAYWWRLHAIDSVVRGCHIYKDVWSAVIDSKLTCSPESAIVKTGMPLHTHTRSDTPNPQVTLWSFVVGINFHRKEVTRNLFSKGKASLKYPKINSLRK